MDEERSRRQKRQGLMLGMVAGCIVAAIAGLLAISGLVSGEVLLPGKYGTSVVRLAEDAAGFWTGIALLLAAAIVALGIGVWSALVLRQQGGR